MKSLITTADERLAQPPRTNITVTGRPDAGKTTLARTLPADETLFIDLEAGIKALADWRGDVLEVRKVATAIGVNPWELARALACVMCGPDPASQADDLSDPYSKANYEVYMGVFNQQFGENFFDKYRYVFWDSVTDAARLSFGWCMTQPEAISEKTGKRDTRGAYGLHGREMVRWLKTIQHTKDKSTILACILNEEVDDLRRVSYELQIDGGKAKAELPGIFDNIMTLSVFQDSEGKQYRALVCQGMNQWGFPAKDRSGALDVLEPPDLMHVIKKSSTGPRISELVNKVPDNFTPGTVSRPSEPAADPEPAPAAATTAGAFNPNKAA